LFDFLRIFLNLPLSIVVNEDLATYGQEICAEKSRHEQQTVSEVAAIHADVSKIPDVHISGL